MKKFQKAFKFYEKAVEILTEIKDKSGAAKAYNNMGNCFGQVDDFDQALVFYKNLLKYALKLEIKPISLFYWKISVLFIQDLTFFQKHTNHSKTP